MARRLTNLFRASWVAVALVAYPRFLPAQIPDWLAGHRVLILRTTAGPVVAGVVTSRRGDSITVTTTFGRRSIRPLEPDSALRRAPAESGRW